MNILKPDDIYKLYVARYIFSFFNRSIPELLLELFAVVPYRHTHRTKY